VNRTVNLRCDVAFSSGAIVVSTATISGADIVVRNDSCYGQTFLSTKSDFVLTRGMRLHRFIGRVRNAVSAIPAMVGDNAVVVTCSPVVVSSFVASHSIRGQFLILQGAAVSIGATPITNVVSWGDHFVAHGRTMRFVDEAQQRQNLKVSRT
jgi:hypothetical protein